MFLPSNVSTRRRVHKPWKVNVITTVTFERTVLIRGIVFLSLQVGKSRRSNKDDKKKPDEGVGMNVKSIVVVALLMMLMLFSVHCTWVTSNAYSSPSIVLASYGHDG